MMVVIAILINIFIAYHFKKYLNKHRVVAAVIRDKEKIFATARGYGDLKGVFVW